MLVGLESFEENFRRLSIFSDMLARARKVSPYIAGIRIRDRILRHPGPTMRQTRLGSRHDQYGGGFLLLRIIKVKPRKDKFGQHHADIELLRYTDGQALTSLCIELSRSHVKPHPGIVGRGLTDISSVINYS